MLRRLIIISLPLVMLACLSGYQVLRGLLRSSDTQTTTQQGTPDSNKLPHTARATFRFPDDKTSLANDFRFVALYGTPGSASLGALGQQPIEQSIERVRELAAAYQSHSKQTIYPTFEIITTVASAGPTANGDYSSELDPAMLLPWITAAREHGVYVVLDLQPGRSDFLSQAKQYEALLRQPHVGLALDPEWRIGPDETPVKRVGSVSAAEINQVADWLHTLVVENDLPEKVLLLHQFKLSMITDRDKLAIPSTLLAILQMDGHGTPQMKQQTWRVLQTDLPANIRMGWKNFYARDEPLLTPMQTMEITPTPWFVSYQ